MQVIPPLFSRPLVYFFALFLVLFPYLATATEAPQYETFACKYFHIVLVPLGVCQPLLETPTPVSDNPYLVTDSVPPVPGVLGTRITTVTPVTPTAFTSTSTTRFTTSSSDSFEKYTDRRFTGLLSHVHWLINRIEQVPSAPKLGSQYDRQIERLQTSQAENTRRLTNGGDFVDGTLTNFTIASGTASNLSLISPVFTNPTLATNLTTNGFWLSHDGDDEGLFIDEDGNVGFGTSTPSDRLSVTGGAIFLENFTPTLSTTNRIHANNGSLYWSGGLIAGATVGTWDTDGTHVSRSSGNVGIGTTTPSERLVVDGKSLFLNDVSIQGLGSTPLSVSNNQNAITQLVVSNSEAGTSAEARHIINSNDSQLFLSAYPSSNTSRTEFAGNVGLYTSTVQNSDIFLAARGSNQNIRFYTGGHGAQHRRMTITNTGNVGIGTAEPTSQLDIRTGSGGSRITVSGGTGGSIQGDATIMLRSANATGGNLSTGSINVSQDGAGNTSGAYMNFATRVAGGSLTEKMRITNTGNVGIGTISPTGKLHVLESSLNNVPKFVRTTSNTTDTAYGTFKLLASKDNDMGDGFGASMIFTIQDNTSAEASIAEIAGVRDGTDNSGALAFSTRLSGVDSEKLRIDSSGNVGIGTTTPSEKLHVMGRIMSDLGSGRTITIGDSGSVNRMVGTGGLFQIGTTDVNNMQFITSGTERMRITSSGNIGIGTTDPVHKFVVSDGGNTGFEVIPSDANDLVTIAAYDRGESAYKNMVFKTSTNDQQLYLSTNGLWVFATPVLVAHLT